MKKKVSSQVIEDKIIKARIKLLQYYPFFGYLALSLELKEDFAIATIGTDGEHIFYNPDFIAKLKPKELQTLIAHEVLHCALGHLWRRGFRKKKKWNWATDFATNLILKKAGFLLPAGGLLDSRFDEMSAEMIYRRLPNYPPVKGSLLDCHDYWLKEGEFKKSAQEIKTEKAWRERTTWGVAKNQFPKLFERLISDRLKPKLDWRLILNNFLTPLFKSDFRLIPPSKKHLWRKIYLPSVHSEAIEIAVAVDTSASISEKTFQEFIAEIRNITEQFSDYVLHLFFCDWAIHKRLVITPQDSWPKKFPKADRGTDFKPVFQCIAKDNLPIVALVYLTDGLGLYPACPPPYPVIWVLNTHSYYRVPWGMKVYINK